MSKMWFSTDKLIKVIKKNREGHRAEFEEAMAGYEEKAVEQLSNYIAAIKAGKRPHITLHMTMPQDHTKDYDRVLAMLTMTEDGKVELEEDDFSQYVQDDWGWKQQFAATNSMYMKAK